MKTGTVFESARDHVLSALLGNRTAGAASGLSLAGRIGMTVFAIGAATLVLMAGRSVGVIGTASFYFPAILVVTLFAGWELGVCSVAASAALIRILPSYHLTLTPIAIFVVAGLFEVLLAGFLREFLRDAWRTELALRTLAEQREREAGEREIVLGEARHRLKNLMAIIEALAKFSGTRPGEDPVLDAFMQRFLGRLRALGTASDLVLKFGPNVLEANAVVAAVLEPFLSDSPQRLRFQGPKLELSEHFGGALAMAVHELATNALKYGALSHPSGSVDFRWSAVAREGGDTIEFVWRENGGPSPKPPEKDGYGHRLIRSVAAREIDGEVRLDYAPDGLVCRIAYRRPGTAAAENRGTA